MAAIHQIWKISPDGKYTIFELSSQNNGLDEISRQLPEGAYTTFRTYQRNHALRLQKHLHRLAESAEIAGKPMDLDIDFIRNILRLMVKNSEWVERRIRISLDLELYPGTIYLFHEPLHVPSDEAYRSGVKTITTRYHRSQPKAKTTSFIELAANIRRSLPPGVNEAILVDEHDRLLEGTSSNFFAVFQGEIWTADQEVLSGITRSIVLDVVEEAKIPVRFDAVRLQDVPKLTEAFITSASRGVLPVSHIDGTRVASDLSCPGTVTQRIMDLYQGHLLQELETI